MAATDINWRIQSDCVPLTLFVKTLEATPRSRYGWIVVCDFSAGFDSLFRLVVVAGVEGLSNHLTVQGFYVFGHSFEFAKA
ncbi:hypothetical protein HF325_006930 [Metschnikowia pulcherrima]|uniref:Uncharacterized protein n=1 Tax=Metschnikowia pulcherrima TaxID=27326 RepID=A0A8H7GKG1_9ASCO|nr:hypothetical protein HF325_006930 [Metschnikowia pulcherrima]